MTQTREPEVYAGIAQKLEDNVTVNLYNVLEEVSFILNENLVTNEENTAAWLLKAITCIDLTTLAGDDTRTNVTRLCMKAANPLPQNYYEKLGFPTENFEPFTTAAVCVYPSRVADAAEVIRASKKPINVAAVATGFPTGQYGLKSRLEEIEYAVKNGASEIDVVIDRSLAIGGKWGDLYDELVEMRKACGNSHMKVILAVGEIVTMENIFIASMLSMYAGADFIKTSTGKEEINATLPVGLVMCRAIRQYYADTNRKVGLKPAGGIKTCKDAIKWLTLIKTQLGDEWLTPELFRIGASSLLGDIEKWFYDYLETDKVKGKNFSFI